MGITVLKNNVPWGPFTRAQIDEGLERGDFDLSTLAHAPGVKATGLPLEEVLDRVERGALLPPIPSAQNLPPVPPPMPSPEAIAAKPLQVPLRHPGRRLLQRMPPWSHHRPRPSPRDRNRTWTPPRSFLRGIAFLLDCAILFVPILLLMFSLSAVVILKSRDGGNIRTRNRCIRSGCCWNGIFIN